MTLEYEPWRDEGTPQSEGSSLQDIGAIEHFVVTHEALTEGYDVSKTTLGHNVPRGLRLTGSGWRIDVTFLASPLLGAPRPNLGAVSAAAAAAAAERRARDEAAEAYYDEDDD